jgi:hypothetical protein
MVLAFRLIYLPPALHYWVLYWPIHSLIYLFMYWLILASRSFFLSGEAWSRNSLF